MGISTLYNLYGLEAPPLFCLYVIIMMGITARDLTLKRDYAQRAFVRFKLQKPKLECWKKFIYWTMFVYLLQKISIANDEQAVL